MHADSAPRESGDVTLDPGTAPAVLGTATSAGFTLACGIVTGLIAARCLGPTGRGQLAVITVWASTLLYSGTLGLAEAVVYFAAAEPALRARVWMTAQLGAAILGVLIAILGWWLIPLLFSSAGPSAIAGSIQWYLLLFAVPCLSSLCACAWLQGVGRLWAFNVTRTSVHVVSAIGFVILLLARDASVWHFASILLIGNAAAAILAAALGPWPFVRGQGPSRALAGRMLHYGLRVQVGNWSSAINARLDQLLLALFTAPASLGVYVVAATYAQVVLTIPGSATVVMLPEMVNEHREGTASACLARWYRRLVWMTATGCTIAVASGVYLLPLLFGRAFEAAVPLLVLLGPAAVLFGMNQLLVTAFQGVDRPEIGSAAEFLALVVTAVSLAVLIPRYGIYGAAAASLLACGTSHVYLLRKSMAVFGAELRLLCVPTRADVDALVRAGTAACTLLRRSPVSLRRQAGAIP